MNDRINHQDYFRVSQEQDRHILTLQGVWSVHNVADIQHHLEKFFRECAKDNYEVNLLTLESIDTAGAWLVKKYFKDNAGLQNLNAQQKSLFEFLPDEMETVPSPPKRSFIFSLFYSLGLLTAGSFQSLYKILSFVGRIALRFLANFFHPRHFRLPSIVRHIYETGIQAIPIVTLLGLLMSMVISYQASVQLQKFGASLFVIDLGVVSVLREMGVLITAIMVAGRSGSAFASEIGVMKLREEVDALRTMGIDPIEVLVLPRILALIIALPLLTMIADVVGIAGGSLMSLVLLDIPLSQYFDRAEQVATFNMFFVGMVKAPVFAFLIALAGTYQGMNVSGSAESVGRLTTVAVVQSIFLVIMADALFSILFSKMGI